MATTYRDFFPAKNTDGDDIFINMKTGEVILEGSPELEDIETDKLEFGDIGTVYNPDSTNTMCKRFMKMLFPNLETFEYFHRLIGYLFTGHTSENLVLVLEDPKDLPVFASTGKSTFFEMLRFLGLSKYTPQDIDTTKCRCLIFTPRSTTKHLRTCQIKELAYSEPFHHQSLRKIIDPQYKIIFDNTRESATPSYEFDDTSEEQGISLIRISLQAEFNKELGVDCAYLEKCRTPEAQTGLLNFVIAGAMKWYEASKDTIGGRHRSFDDVPGNGITEYHAKSYAVKSALKT